MPWIKNQVEFQPDVRGIYMTANANTSTFTYRSRTPIDTALMSMPAMMFKLPNVPEGEQRRYTRFGIWALVKGLDDANLIAHVKTALRNEEEGYPNCRIVTVYNMNSNQTAATTAVNALLADGWVQHDFRAALSCDPFHSTIVLHKASEAGGHTVIFSTITNDAFVLKVAAVIPVLCGITIPADLTKALLEGDKALFNAAYYKEIGEIIKQKARAKMLSDLDRLGDALQKEGTSGLTEKKANIESNIRDYLQALKDKYVILKALDMQLSSPYWADMSANAVAFINYIKQYSLDMITRMQFEGAPYKVSMGLITPLLYWDEKLYQNYLHSSSSNFVKDTGAQGMALLNNILLDKTVEVLFHTGVMFDFRNNTFGQRTALLGTEEYVGIPHSHIHYHNCLGDNAPLITKAFNSKDYIVLWEQIKATLSGINVTDSIVFKKFVADVTTYYTETPFLKLKDTGELLTNREFYKRYPKGYVPTPVAEPEPDPVVEKKPVRRLRQATADVEREEE